jgi:hypothetical protein
VFGKILKLIFPSILVLVIVVILMINLRLTVHPKVVVEQGDLIREELLGQLRGLNHALERGADVEMQNIYPEGYVFLNAVYSLAWSSFLNDEGHARFFDEGHAEILRALENIHAPKGREAFSEDLPLSHGAFYNGWSAYVLASLLRLEDSTIRDEANIHHFKRQCDEIAEVIQRSTFPESYAGSVWPADVTLCVASLALHDQMFEPKYQNVNQTWVSKIKTHLDPRGMIPHAYSAAGGSVLENARGSSMALTLIFLRDIDAEFAQQQFNLFRINFVDSRFGLTGIREYPKGQSGSGDIDSGPVLLNFGGAATIVGMQTLSLFGERETALKIRNAVEALAFPTQRGERKQYFFGKIPMADAFITWSHSQMEVGKDRVMFKAFHSYSLLLVTILSACFWFFVKRSPS